MMDIVKSQRDRADKVKKMMATEGWEIIVEDLTVRARELTAELLEAQSIEEVYRLQALIKSHKAFFDTVARHASVSTD